MRSPSPVRAVPKVFGAPAEPSSADAPGWYWTAPSDTRTSSIDSPSRNGTSRNAPVNGPSKAKARSSSTDSVPSCATTTSTAAWGRASSSPPPWAQPRARPRRRRSELHAWGLPGRLLDLEERLALEVEPAGDEVRGHGLTRVLVRQHRVVVDLACDANLVLGVLELRLQLLEVLARAQLGIGLGDREQSSDRGGERVLGLRLLLDS